jgi:hypothetical protein
MLALAPKAERTVAEAIEGGDVRTSLQVLRGIGALSGERVSVGSDDPEVLRQEAKIERHEEDSDRALRGIIAQLSSRPMQGSG